MPELNFNNEVPRLNLKGILPSGVTTEKNLKLDENELIHSDQEEITKFENRIKKLDPVDDADEITHITTQIKNVQDTIRQKLKDFKTRIPEAGYEKEG